MNNRRFVSDSIILAIFFCRTRGFDLCGLTIERVFNAYLKMYFSQGRIQDFFRRGALVSCSTSKAINHIVSFLQNTSWKPQVISGGGGGVGGCGPPAPTPNIRPCFFCYGVNLTVEQPITRSYKIQKSGQHVFSFSYHTDCFSTIVVIINPQVLPRSL